MPSHSNGSIQATPSSATASKSSSSPTALTFGEPREDEYPLLARIILEGFEESSKHIFGGMCQELIDFRISLVRHRHELAKLCESGKIQSKHYMMVARKDQIAVGLAIWSIEDDWSEEGTKKRTEEAALATPMTAPPSATNMLLYKQCGVEFAKKQKEAIQDRPWCCK
jgi:hypothetical protein